MKRKKKIWAGVISAVVVLLCMAILVVANIALNMLVKPEMSTSHDEDKAYGQLFKDFPQSEEWVDSLKNAKALQDTFIVVPDGRRLHAIYCKAQNPTTKTAFIIHGWRDSSIRMLRYGYMFSHDLEYNIFLPDLNHHGKSEGESIQMGWLDRLDAMRWMDIANDIFKGESEQSQMVVFGISMGAATTMCISGEEQKPYVDAYIEDCGYTSVWDEVVHNQEGVSLSKAIIPVSSWLCGLRYGWTFDKASPLNQVKKCTKPMMFIHGDQDDFVPTWMVYPLFDSKPGAKELWIAQGSDHAKAYTDHQRLYTEKVHGFLTRHTKVSQ